LPRNPTLAFEHRRDVFIKDHVASKFIIELPFGLVPSRYFSSLARLRVLQFAASLAAAAVGKSSMYLNQECFVI